MRLRSCILSLAAAGAVLLSPMTLLAQDVTGGGAAFPAAVYQKWIAMVKAENGLTVTYGTVGGPEIWQSRMLAREADFSVSGQPMPATVRTAGNVLQVPILIGAVVPVFNLPGIDSGRLNLNGTLLGRIFVGAIRKWNDPAIAAVNPGLALPDLDIRPFSIRDGGLAASFGFTQYILAADEEWRQRHGSMVTRRWAVGSSVEDAPAMVENVRLVEGSIGYMPYGTAARARLPLVALLNPAGKYVVASLDSIRAAADNAPWDKAADLVMVLVNQPGAQSWPMSQTSYAQMPLAPKDPARSAAVRRFFEFALGNGSSALAELGFVPLPERVRQRVRAELSNITS